MKSNDGPGSAERALALLLLFSEEREELRVGDFARALGVHKSTASRLATTLEASGFLRRAGAREGFRLGPSLARLGVLALGGRGWSEVARPALERLAEETGETAVLSVAAGHESLDVLQASGRHVVGAGSWVGRRMPLHASSDGKVLLAFGAGVLPEGPLPRVARATITERASLLRALETARRRGYADALSEAEDGLNGVAVPVLGEDGRCRGAVSVSGPDYRLTAERLAELVAPCRRAVAAIRRELHWDDDDRREVA